MGFNEFIGKLFGNKNTRDMREIQPWVEKAKQESRGHRAFRLRSSVPSGIPVSGTIRCTCMTSSSLPTCTAGIASRS